MGAEPVRRQNDQPDEQPSLRIFDLQGVEEVRGEVQSALTIRAEMEALQAAEVMSEEPYNLHDLYCIVMEARPLVRADLINATSNLQEGLVLNAEDLDHLLTSADVDHFVVIDKYGRSIRIFQGCIPDGGELIILPEHLGEEEGKPSMRIAK